MMSIPNKRITFIYVYTSNYACALQPGEHHTRNNPISPATERACPTSYSHPSPTMSSSLPPRPHCRTLNTPTSLTVVRLTTPSSIVPARSRPPCRPVMCTMPNLFGHCLCLLNLVVVCPTSPFLVMHMLYPNLNYCHMWLLASSSFPSTCHHSCSVASPSPSCHPDLACCRPPWCHIS
jgi:hypothetical protein